MQFQELLNQHRSSADVAESPQGLPMGDPPAIPPSWRRQYAAPGLLHAHSAALLSPSDVPQRGNDPRSSACCPSSSALVLSREVAAHGVIEPRGLVLALWSHALSLLVQVLRIDAVLPVSGRHKTGGLLGSGIPLQMQPQVEPSMARKGLKYDGDSSDEGCGSKSDDTSSDGYDA